MGPRRTEARDSVDAGAQVLRPPLPPGAHAARRRAGFVAAAVVLVGVLAAALNLAIGSGGSGSHVQGNSVAAVDPKNGRIPAKIDVGAEPRALTLASDSLWVANTSDRTVSRIDARTGQPAGTIPLEHDAYPSDLAAAARAVWIVNGPQGRLLRIDPKVDDVSDTKVAVPGCGGPQASLAAGGGSLWLACFLLPSAYRIDPETRRVTPFARRAGLLTSTSPKVVPHLSAIAYGAGIVWVADAAQNLVVGVDPSTLEPVRRLAVGVRPVAIAIGYGAVWVANAGDGTVSRIPITRGRAPGVHSLRVGGSPVAVAAGEGGVWVANAATRSLLELSPRTGRVVRRMPLGNPPADVVAGGGYVWASVDSP